MRAVLLGKPESLELAYPAAIIDEIASAADLCTTPVPGGEWRRHGDLLSNAQVIFSTWGMPPLDSELLAAAPELQAVFYAAGSVRSFALPEAFERGIRIFSAWQANAVPVAEYTVAATVLLLKRFFSLAAEYRSAGRRPPVTRLAGAYGSRVGLVSLGAIGRMVAERLASFDVEVLAYDPYVSPGRAAELGCRLVGIDELFACCDVVSIHAPWLPETEGMIGETLLDSMKEGAALLNTSRGAVVDEAGLCRVLARRPDLYALLDVTYPEPPDPGSPLFSLPNVLLTPHIAGSVGGEVARMGRYMVDEFLRFRAGAACRYEVCPDMLARMA